MLEQFRERLSPAGKYWIFLTGIVAAIFTAILGSFMASYLGLDPADRDAVAAIFPKLVAFPLLGAIVLVAIVGTLVRWLFLGYVLPILRMAEQTRLITVANPGYRVTVEGAPEVSRLAGIINESAEAFQRLQEEVGAQIAAANRALQQERNRFAAILAELPNGVVVCNVEGQILLYNQKAQEFLNEAAPTEEHRRQTAEGAIGLGRPIFEVLDREPIVRAIETMRHALRTRRAPSLLGMMTRLCGERFIRVNMAPVFAGAESEPTLGGFVLTLEDITGELVADNERDYQLQRVIDAIQHSIGELHKQMALVCALPGVGAAVCQQHRRAVETISADLERQLASARELYSRHRLAFGSLEVLAGEVLLQALRREVHERFAMEVAVGAVAECWLRIDSYAIVQAVGNLAGFLRAEHSVSALELRLFSGDDDRALLAIAWPTPAVPPAVLTEWEGAPLFMDADGRTHTPRTIVALHGGTIAPVLDPAGLCSELRIALPVTVAGLAVGVPNPSAPRPVYYQFDLFHQPGQQALGHLPLRQLIFVVFDTETTGLDPTAGDEIIQLGAVRIVNGRLHTEEVIDQLVNPQRPVPESSVAVHGISPESLKAQPLITEVLPRFHAFAREAVLVAHNAAFDMRMLQLKEAACGVRFDHPVLDTLLLSTIIHPNLEGHSLDTIAARLNVRIVGRHTALGDAMATAEILLKLIPLLEAQGITTLDAALRASARSPYARLAF